MVPSARSSSGRGIEGLVHISEMAAHHVESPDQVVSAGEELWVKIIELDTARRRISLSIKQAAEGGEVSEEYREAFGSHAYDTEVTTSVASSTASSPPRPRRRPPGRVRHRGRRQVARGRRGTRSVRRRDR